MSTTQLRKELHELINKADERILNLMHAMLQGDMKENDYEISEEHKEILDGRLDAHTENPKAGSSWKEVKSRIKSRNDL